MNRVRVIVQDDSTRTFYESIAENSEVTAGLELPREMIYGPESGKWTQALADAIAGAYLAEYNQPVKTFKARLQASTKLRLGQKIKFTNVDGHPTDWMRITSISHSGEVANELTEIEYSIGTLDMVKSRKVPTNISKEIEIIAKNEVDKLETDRMNRDGEINAVVDADNDIYDVKIVSTGQILKNVKLV